MQSSRSMTTGRPLGLLLRFALPLMLGNTFQLIYTIADSAVVGRLIGVNAFAAVGAAGTIYWLAVNVILGLNQGFGTHIAQKFGEANPEKLKSSFSMTLFLTLVMGAALSVTALLLTRPMLRLLNTPPELLEDAAAYLQILFAGLIVTFFFNSFAAAFRAVGNSRIPFYALILSCILNIALDVLLVLWTDLGVAAVAAATILAQLLSGLFCLYHLRKITAFHLRPRDLKPKLSVLKELLILGGPVGFRDLVIACGGILVQYFINGYGAIFIAGVATAKKMHDLMGIIGGALDGAIATFVAQNYGARDMRRIRRGVRCAFWLMTGSVLLVIVLLLLFGRQVMGLLFTGDAAQVRAVLQIAEEQLRIFLLFLPGLYYLYLFRSSLQGLGNSVMPMVSGFIEFAVRIAGILILPLFLGKWGVYLPEAVAWPIAALQLFIAYTVIFRNREAALRNPKECTS